MVLWWEGQKGALSFVGLSKSRVDSRFARLFATTFASRLTPSLAKRTTHIFVLRTKRVTESSSPTTKKGHQTGSFFCGGGWWIRTTEVSDNRFTVCPLWPLGKSPILLQDWSWRTESNHQPADYKSAALPLSHASILPCNGDILSHKYQFVNSKFKFFYFFILFKAFAHVYIHFVYK